MKWNNHSNLAGSHAFLSASKSTWLGKTDEELIDAYLNSYATQIGTLMHAYAADAIRFREKLRKADAKGAKFDLMRRGIPEFAIDIQSFFPTMIDYVNDSIGFNMDPEVLLYYSDLCYGTADAIQFDGQVLRIHDLKTGTTPAKMDQLKIYAALFFLEYSHKPERTRIELRIYQSGETVLCEPDADEVRFIMDGIVEKDAALQKLKEV